MTAPVIAVTPADSVAQCADILDRYRLKRLLVVENGSLVGIVTRGDLLKALATANAVQAGTVDDSVIRERLFSELETRRWAHLLSKSIVVQNGIVDISGFVETEDERHALRIAAENIPGVKRVEDHARTRPLFRLG
jgi:CBS domain-containing protein